MASVCPVREVSHAVIADVAAVRYGGGLGLSHMRAAVVEREAVVRMQSLI